MQLLVLLCSIGFSSSMNCNFSKFQRFTWSKSTPCQYENHLHLSYGLRLFFSLWIYHFTNIWWVIQWAR